MGNDNLLSRNEKVRKPLADKWAGELCILNGKPARVVGRSNPFATVASLDGQLEGNWSWESVDSTMNGKKSFFV